MAFKDECLSDSLVFDGNSALVPTDHGMLIARLLPETGAVRPESGTPGATGGHLGAAVALRGFASRQREAVAGDARQEGPGRFHKQVFFLPSFLFFVNRYRQMAG